MTRSATWSLGVVAALLIGVGTATTTADAEPRTHDGFFLQLAPGLGYYSMSAEAGGIEASYSGMTFDVSFMLGGTIMPGLQLGGGLFFDRSLSPTYEMNGEEVSGLDFSQIVLGLGPMVDYHLDPSGGLHFQFFFGWGGVETATEEGGMGGSDPTGLILYVAAGYDLFIADEWSVGGLFRVAYGMFSLDDVDYPTIAPALLLTLTLS